MSSSQAADYAEAIELHRDELRAHCMRILRSSHDAEDAVQEALLRGWRSLHQFEGRGSFRSWLYRIATNASLDQLRRRPEPLITTELADQVEPTDHLERRESLARLVEAAGRLTPTQRGAFILRDIVGLSAQETADVLGTTVAAVNSAVQRARPSIRQELGAGE